jgi:hypothetical protein
VPSDNIIQTMKINDSDPIDLAIVLPSTIRKYM